MNISDLEELSHAWEEIRAEYDTLSDAEYDQKVLHCAAGLAADPAGELAYAWTLGLVLMAPYLGYAIDDTGKPEAVAALRAADGALHSRPCAHDEHPYEEHEEEFDLDLAEQLRGLADPAAEWDENHSREVWLCPSNIAGFARIALDIIEPGSVRDVPPRLPVGTEDKVRRLASVLHGYPLAGTDVEWELTAAALDLSHATPEDRPGHLLTVQAVTSYVTSDWFEQIPVLDELIGAVEKTLPHYAQATCDHDQHAEPPHRSREPGELGIVLSSPGGRALYELDRNEDEDAPLQNLLCPVALASIAEESLHRLRSRRAWLTSGQTASPAPAQE
ncbi:hypothetical protein AV521_43615 [Streptomyces sp. IMTB 2501]|uniref:hypothetical protein n=1 Tax=Streptomyces sp. IMTB 2501 TaxID=1776340 RepID=UPI00096BDA92|nr:hypothetical protein [Streptomyces sp. IMTB 2501]OLZ61340.1 hypothetical protein AV521_43615 [Streptomyces sp. IMTB 2501]